MTKLLIGLLFLFSGFNNAFGSITISFIKPLANQASDSILQIEVNVVSTYQISTVTGNVSGHVSSLYYYGGPFVGTLSLAGLPQGIPLQLTVVATDVFNTQQSATITFIYAKPPVIHLVSPLNESNAYPLLPVKAYCTGIDTSTLRVRIDLSQTVFDRNFTDAIDTVLSLHPVQNDYGTIYFYATDRWGQQTSVSRTVLFDSTPYLSHKYSDTGRIFDFNYNKVLLADPSLYVSEGKIADVSTGNSTKIKNSSFSYQTLASLTPFGAMFSYNQLNDWNADSLYQLINNTGAKFSTSGQYASWVKVGLNEAYVNRRNLATRTNTQIATITNTYTRLCDVDSNGIVVFSDGTNIKKYINNGISTVVNSGTNTSPITDGNYIVYLKFYQGDYKVYLHDGTAEIDLNSILPYVSFPEPEVEYQVNNKFVAYAKPGTSGQMQIWRRDSTGVNSQATFFSTTSTLEALNAKGDIMFHNNNKRYLARRGVLLPKELGAAMGKAYYRDTSWYVSEGRHLYKLLVNGVLSVANGNWNDPSIWENNTVPPPGSDVIIVHNVTVNTNVVCNTLTIHSPATVTVLTGYTLTILN